MGPSGLEPLPIGRDLQSRCRIRTTFSPLLYLVIESNYRPLHVKQIRYHYANEANLILRFEFFAVFYELVTVTSPYPLKVMLLLPDIKSIVLHFKA